MKKLILAFLLIFCSCQKKMATFMPSQEENFKEEKSIQFLKKEIPNVKVNPEYHILREEFLFENNATEIALNNAIPDKSTKIYNRLSAKTPSKKVFSKANARNYIQKEIKKENTKKKRKRNPIFNDGVKIGIVFLGIAIVLAILSFNQLSLLFGVVSAIFFVIGLKKYMRKKRLRNLFS